MLDDQTFIKDAVIKELLGS